MLESIKRKLGFAKKGPLEGTSLVINSEKLERRIALIQKGSLEQYYVEREGSQHIVGSIFKGKVKNIEESLKAMFVDIGLEKNAFLHFWDAIPAALEQENESFENENRNSNEKKITARDIPRIYPIGSDILIQVSKVPVGNKGPRVTTNISIPGRYLVLSPNSHQLGISQKISDNEERKRLRKIYKRLEIPEGVGIIMRTAAQGRKFNDIADDLEDLLAQWNEIEEKVKNVSSPALVFNEPSLVERSIRDLRYIDQIICDNQDIENEANQLLSKFPRKDKIKVRYFPSDKPIFEEIGIEKQIETIFKRKVPLDCGGYLVIDETEALIAVDVNTGKNKGEQNANKTILNTNIEAVEALARQLKLRNIGGIIVIDLIDMRNKRNQDKIYRTMLNKLKDDKARTQVLPVSAFGLMEVTRQRLSESIEYSTYEPCSYCQEKGRVKTTMSVSIEIQRKLNAFIRENQTPRDLLIVVQSDVLQRLKEEDSNLIIDIERSHKGRISFRSDINLHREEFKIYDPSNEKLLWSNKD